MNGLLNWRLLVALAFLGLPGTPALAEGSPPRDILFVGNSFTYYNNGLSTHYRNLVQSAFTDAATTGRIRMMTISGGRLSEHYAGLRFMLNDYDWDVVVLQGYSNEPIMAESAASFRDSARTSAGKVRADGAEPVLFMTWAYSDKPGMTSALSDAYRSIGNELDVQVVPVGLAFAQATEARPDIELRISDKKHPTVAGTYLAACVFFAALTEMSPEGLSYRAGLPADVATFLQSTAWNAVKNYRQ